MAIEDDLIIKAQGATEGVGCRSSVKTGYGSAKARDDFEQTACALAEEDPQANRTRQFEKRLHTQGLTINGSDRMQHFELQRTDDRQIGNRQWRCPHRPGSTGIRDDMRLCLAEVQALELPSQGWELLQRLVHRVRMGLSQRVK